jgi:hypothetical protein
VAAVLTVTGTAAGIPDRASGQVGVRGGSGIDSPAVSGDGRVTFRLKAPQAGSVTVTGDFGADAAMTRGDDGVWSVTVGPLAPDEYAYSFVVDEVRLVDPSNPQVKIGYVTSTTTSLLTVPSATPAFYDVRDVTHGEVRTLLRPSRSSIVRISGLSRVDRRPVYRPRDPDHRVGIPITGRAVASSMNGTSPAGGWRRCAACVAVTPRVEPWTKPAAASSKPWRCSSMMPLRPAWSTT